MSECPGNPELLAGLPIGMYHCEYCGEMVIAGLPHPPKDTDFNDHRKLRADL